MLNAGFITFYFVFMLIGVLSYISFSPIDSGSMTAVLREFYVGWPVDSINVMVALAVLLTYPLQFFAAIEVIEEYCGIGYAAEEQEKLEQAEIRRLRETATKRSSPPRPQSYVVGGGATVNPLADEPSAESPAQGTAAPELELEVSHQRA